MPNTHFQERKVGYKILYFGIPHPSGLNRHQRRSGESIEQHKPFHEKQERIEDHKDLVKASRVAAIARRVESARGRAMERKVQRNKPAGTMTRARLSIVKRMAQRVNDRRARHAKHLAKIV